MSDSISQLEQLRRDMDPDSPDELVEFFFDDIGLPARWRETLAPFVRSIARDLMRNNVRSIEKKSLPGVPTSKTKPANVNKRQRRGKKTNPAIERSEALAETFYTGEHWISWGEATISDHEARVTFLTRQRDGLNESIKRHLDTIAMLRKAKMSCLNDLESAA